MKKIIFTGLILIYSLASCKKEIITPTPADKITTELQKVISTNAIKKVYPIIGNNSFPDTFPSNAGNSWIFSNGFIQINGYLFNQSINLNFLTHYDVLQIKLDNGTSVKALILYFNY
ncbi:MAG: hypothetical protein IE931_13760 [Sphingobacteriales bacterium]|nr:hypothetical protein [Sphingobacteriales bacterium]